MFLKWFVAFCCVFCFPLTVACDEEDEFNETLINPNIINLQGIPSAIVGNAVNVITGAYCDSATDLSIAGAQPIQIQRCYSSATPVRKPQSIDGFFGKNQVWNWNHGGYIRLWKKSTRSQVHQAIVFEGGSLLGTTYETMFYLNHLLIHGDAFRQKITNYDSEEISGRTNPENLSIHYFPKQKMCKLINGAKTCSYAYAVSPDSHNFQFRKTVFLNGNQLTYHYDKNNSLSSITAKNSNKTSLAKVTFTYPEDDGDIAPVIVKAPDGRSVSYYFDKGKTISKRLRRVVRSDGPEEKYYYAKGDDVDVIVRKEYPNHRYLNIKYNKHKNSGAYRFGSVSSLSAPIGCDDKPIRFYTFKHHPGDHDGRVEVWDALSHKKEYYYDYCKRLDSIITFNGCTIYKKEKFIYEDGNGALVENLSVFLLREGKTGPILSCRHLEYDRNNNITNDWLYGNLSGYNQTPINVQWNIPTNNGCERYNKKSTHLIEGANRLVSEENGRSIVKYTYDSGSDRLAAKIICDLHGKIKERHFYRYDDNAVLVEEIIDNGSVFISQEISEDNCLSDRQDLTNVTERKIIRITPRKTMPIGLPEVIEENCLNVAMGKEFLICKKHNVHSTAGQLLQQDYYGSDGQLAYSLKWRYDEKGNLIKESNALGEVTTYAYDENGNKIYEKRPGTSYCENFVYDYSNRLIAVEELHNNGECFKTTHRYNLCSQRIATVDRYGNETTYDYDPLGRLITTEYPLVSSEGTLFHPVETMTYNVLDQPISTTDTNGHTTETKFTIRGQPYEILYPSGMKERFQYTLDGLLSKHWAVDGVLTTTEYDYQGRPTKKSLYSSTGTLLYTTTSTYNAFHKLSETDPAGHLTTYKYDPFGRLKEQQKGEQRTVFIYDPLGRITKTLEYLSQDNYVAKVQKYDRLDRVIQESIEDDQGVTQSKINYVYNTAGDQIQVIQSIDHKSATTTTVYDAYHRPIKITDAEGNATHIKYNENYQNSLGQYVLCKETTDPLGCITQEIMNARGVLEKITVKNAFGNILQKKWLYRDGNGIVTKQCEAVFTDGSFQRNVITCWKYDTHNHLISLTEAVGKPEQKSTHFAYNYKGQKVEIIKPNGDVLHHIYDDWGRLQRFYSSDLSFNYCYHYDLNSNVISIDDFIQKTKTTRSYDKYDNLISETLGNGLTLCYRYDHLGRVTRLTYPDSTYTRYSYQGVYLHKITRLGADNTFRYQHIYEDYDFSGNLLTAKLIGQAGSLKQHYDLLGRVLEISSSAWSEKEIVYDPGQNLLQRTIADTDSGENVTYHYKYDALHQLTQEEGPSSHQYQYDSLYNRVNADGRPQHINSLNQLLSDGNQTLSYDTCGNLVKIQQADNKISYTYDALDRLITLTDQNHRYEYTYDNFNRRLSKTISIQEAGNWKKQQKVLYLYQEQNEIGAQENGTFTQLRVLGLGKGAEIGAAVAIELEDKIYAPIHDHAGHVTCLLKWTTGKPAVTYQYTAFGEVIASSELTNPWQYASKRIDSESGFVYFGNRYYAPCYGRWITADPMGFEDGPNLYTYLHNNPLTHFDAYGFETEPVEEKSSSWLSSICSSCSSIFSSTCRAVSDFAVGACEGGLSPIETASSVGGSTSFGGESGTPEGSPSMSTRIGRLIGAGASLYSGGGLAISLTKTALKTGFQYGSRYVVKRAAMKVSARAAGRAVVAAEARAVSAVAAETVQATSVVRTKNLIDVVERGVLAVGRVAQEGVRIQGSRWKFPKNPNELLSDLVRDPKGRIYPSDNLRIRSEQHVLKTGETFSPRHHGQHYHVETRHNSNLSWRKPGNVNTLEPPGYKPGSGTGFLPGESFPGS